MLMMVSTTPMTALLAVFVAVPLSIVIGIYGGEGASAAWHRTHPRSRGR